MSGRIEVERTGAQWRITIDRPDAANRVTDAMIRQLTDAVRDVPGDVALVRLAARGEDFCLGWGDMAAAPEPGTIEALARRRDFDLVFGCYGAFRACPVPVVGAVQGRAAGFGCALVALCDLVVAAEDATFRLPEMEHRILPTMVMSTLIDRLPPKLVNHMVYLAAPIGAGAALSGGLVTEIVAREALPDRVDAVCDTLLSRPAATLRGAKEFMQTAPDLDSSSMVAFARNLHAIVNTSRELKRPEKA